MTHLREQFGEPKSMYKGHNEALIQLAKTNSGIVLLYADFPQDEAGLFYKRECPDRIYNLGIAEANMMTVAAGLAEAGKTPFTHCHSIFAVGRAFNQIRQIAFDRLNVKMILCNTGMFWNFMGGSHQIIEDIAALRATPDLTLLSPSDAVEARKATIAAAEYVGPVAIRLAEPKVPTLFRDDYKFKMGKAVVLREGREVTIVSTGIMLRSCLEAATILEREDIDSGVINVHTLKPLDVDPIRKAAHKTGAIVTVEDSSVLGGLGGAVTETVSEDYPVPILRVGVRDRFGQTGTTEDLAVEYNMSVADIVKTAREVIRKKRI